MSQQPVPAPSENEDDKPLTIGQRIAGIAFALVLIGFGIAMFVNPDMGTEGETSRKLIGKLIIWLWSRPLGVVLFLLAILVLIGSLRVEKKKPDQA